MYCGDYIFSGHTMTLVLAHLVTCGYSPPSWRPLHWLSLLASSTGVLLLLISRGHYTIGGASDLIVLPPASSDVLLAFYVTCITASLHHCITTSLQHCITASPVLADVLLAYYVTTRLWRLYHAVACTTYFRSGYQFKMVKNA